MKNIAYIILALIFSSCFKDIGNYEYSEIEDIVIEGIPDNLGDLILLEDTIKINPVVNPTKGDAGYNYYWSKKEGTGASAKMVRFSEEKNLVFPVNEAGDIMLMFEAQDKETEITRSVITRGKGTSRMSNGYYLLKENSNGTTDVDMIGFDSETGEPIIFENLLESVFNSALEGSPVALDYWGYRYEDIETATLIPVPSIRIASSKDLIVINTDKFEVLAKFDDMFLSDVPTARNIQAIKSIQSNTMLINDGQVYCFANYTDAKDQLGNYFEYGGNNFYPALVGNYYMAEHISWPANDAANTFLTYDESSGFFNYISTSASTPRKVNSRSEQAELANPEFIEPLDASLLFMESVGTGVGNFSVYALLKRNDQPDSLVLIDMNAMQLNNGTLAQNKRTGLLASNHLIDDASNYCVHQLSKIIYFSVGDKLYKYDTLSNKEELIMSFGNEITHIDIVNEWYATGGMLHEMVNIKMIVATQSASEYTFMKFDMNNDTPAQEPFFTIKGEGKVKDYMYIKPSTIPSWVRVYN